MTSHSSLRELRRSTASNLMSVRSSPVGSTSASSRLPTSRINAEAALTKTRDEVLPIFQNGYERHENIFIRAMQGFIICLKEGCNMAQNIIVCQLNKQRKKEQVWPFSGCCKADSQTDAGRYQLYNACSFFQCLKLNFAKYELRFKKQFALSRVPAS